MKTLAFFTQSFLSAQYSLHNITTDQTQKQTDVRTQLSSVRPDTKVICKNYIF